MNLISLHSIIEHIASFQFKAFKSLTWVLVLLSIYFVSCKPASSNREYLITEFHMLSNWQPERTNKTITLDYSEAIDSGFILPTSRQIPEGYFEFGFKFQTLEKSQMFYYKIFYLNETYKYPEDYGMNLMNPLCEENFYGSWENANTEFKSIQKITDGNNELMVKDYFRIAGNPRDEKRYYGGLASGNPISEEEIKTVAEGIPSNKIWYEDVIRKAGENKITINEQLRLDALWVIRENRKNQRTNQRWKRNPRTGQYSFMVVITTEEDLREIPQGIKNIGETWNGHFLNPYWYFKNGPGKKLKNTKIILSKEKLTVSAKPDFSSGIYIHESVLNNSNHEWNKSFYKDDCGSSVDIYHKAHFSQYFHYLMNEMKFKNIPVVKELQGNELSRADYNNYLKTYRPENMVDASIGITDCPCRDVYYDSLKKVMVISTPPTPPGKWIKTNAGIISRHGFTYGKYTAKIKFPELLNENQMWNGLTNAFWMLNESNEEWNRVRTCAGKGYIPKDHNGEFAPRVSTTSYSEIDIEIRKASPVWPVTSYNRPHQRPDYSSNDFEDIIVTCTIWDLACEQPKKFTSGTQFAEYGNQKILWHRWNPWYQALTTKHPVKDDELNKRDYYYYQIEWKPDTIIWSIGPEKDRLKMIAYIDASMTTVPNNQMLMVVTQEYHPSVWWPESPQLLEYIPFTKTPIKGYVQELEIE